MFKVDKRYSRANIQKTIRFNEDLYKDLNKLANKENVSFNTLVLQCCRYALETIRENESDK